MAETDTKVLPSAGKRKPPNAGKGRRKGVPNHATADVRQAIALIAQNNVDDFETWLHAIRDPARRCEVFLKVLAFNLPQLAKVEASVTSRKTIKEMSEDELLALLGEDSDASAQQPSEPRYPGLA